VIKFVFSFLYFSQIKISTAHSHKINFNIQLGVFISLEPMFNEWGVYPATISCKFKSYIVYKCFKLLLYKFGSVLFVSLSLL